MPETSSTSTIKTLNRLIGQYGSPETLVTNNESRITSEILSNFWIKNASTHILSSPYFPQPDGQAERFGDAFKWDLIMSQGKGTTEKVIQNFLRVYRITPNPVSPNVASLSELMFGSKIWTSFDSMYPQKRRDYKPKAKRIGHDGLPVYLRNFW